MALLDWCFPSVAFPDVCSDLLGWDPWGSTSLTFRVYFSSLETGSPRGVHESRAEHHGGGKEAVQTKVPTKAHPGGSRDSH